MRKATVFLVLVMALVASSCDPATETGAPPDEDRDRDTVDLGEIALIGLTTEDSCGDLLSWFKNEAKSQIGAGGFAAWYGGWYGGGVIAFGREAATADAAGGEQRTTAAPSAATTTPVAGADYSDTNVQEAGVDEPDIVKTDGRRLVALAGGHLRVVDLTGSEPALRASLPLPGAHALFLAGDRVMAIGSEATYYPMGTGRSAMPAPGVAVDAIAPVPGYSEQKVTITIVDISDPASPAIEDTSELKGSFVSARMIDGVARLVLRSAPDALIQRLAPPPEQPTSEDEMKALVTTAIDESTIEDWVPSYVPCEQVHHPRGFTGPNMVSVVSVDPADPRPGNGASVAGAGELVYSSARRLYVTTSQWWFGQPADVATTSERAGPSTEIHSFDITDDVTTRYVGSGSVDGMPLNQFSFSEHDEVLRVATTTADGTSGETVSQVATLREDAGRLEQIGLLGGLGKTERIYAVRFLGTQGYVVTFRQTDPLYVIDLSDPASPQLKGELKIPGFSAYLHPIGDGRLLGVGQNATDEGRRLGSQLSLFDVNDPASPKQLATHDLRSYSSSAEYDHHAFLWWPRTGLVVVPVETQTAGDLSGFRQPEYRPGAVGVQVDGDRFVEKRRVEHPTRMPITRSIVVGDRLLTLSETGLLDSDLATLAPGGWMAF